jgi:hypothetical protein
MPAVTIVMNSDTGAVIATVAGVGGTDMVTYNRRNNQYYTAPFRNQGEPVIGVIDAGTNRLVQSIPIPGGIPHSAAASKATGHVYVPSEQRAAAMAPSTSTRPPSDVCQGQSATGVGIPEARTGRRDCLRAASISFLTSPGVRYSRGRRSEFGKRFGGTVPFTSIGAFARLLR